MEGKEIKNFKKKYRKVVPLPSPSGRSEVNRTIRAPREKGAGVIITTSIMEGGDII
jgi:hypothetical protein